VLDAGVLEPYRQVGRAVSGAHDRPLAQLLERDVPDPRRIVSVGIARVEHQDDLVPGGGGRIGASPANCRILGQEQANVGPADLHGAVTTRNPFDLDRGGERDGGIDAEDGRGHHGHGDVGPVAIAG